MSSQPSGFNEAIREVLEHAKKEKGLNQTRLAELVGVSRVNLNRASKSERTIGHKSITKLLEVCECDSEMVRNVWSEWALDIFEKSKIGTWFGPFVEHTSEDELTDILLECARRRIISEDGTPSF